MVEPVGIEPTSKYFHKYSHLHLSKVPNYVVPYNPPCPVYRLPTEDIYTQSYELVSNLFYDRVLDDSVSYA